MIMIERYHRDRNPFYRTCQCQRGVPGYWQKAWQGEDIDEEAQKIIAMCDLNGDAWRFTVRAERTRP